MNNTDAPTLTPTVSDDDKFRMSLAFAVPIFVCFFLLFLLCRKRHPAIYMTNKYEKKLPEQKSLINGDSESSGHWTTKEIIGAFDVLKELWQYNSDEIQERAGFDAMVFTTMLFFMFKLFLILIPLTFILLVPVYVTADTSHNAGDKLSEMTLSNISGAGTWRVWFTVVVAIIVHVWSTWFLRENFRELSIKADKFNAESCESRYTVLIQDVPKEYTEENDLRNFLSSVYPGKVCNVNMCYDLKDVQDLWLEYKEAEKTRELCERTKSKQVGWCCNKKDLETCNQVEEEMKRIFYDSADNMSVIPVAVVQFNDIKTAAICSTAVLIPGGNGMKVRAVPEYPEDVLWRNLSYTGYRRHLGIYLGFVLYIFLIIFYSNIMVFIQGIANLDTIGTAWSGVEDVLNFNSDVRAIIQGTLPAILFSVFFVILPIFLKRLSKLSLPAFKTDEMMLTMTRYSDCLIGMGLLISVFSSGIFSSMSAFTSLSASTIWETLGKEVPAQSVFFLTYIITACFINLSMNLFMVLPFVKNLVGLYTPDVFDYEVHYGVIIMVFTICVTYAVISPLLLVWGTLYFLFAYITYTYQLIYVYQKGNDTGGKHLPPVFTRLSYGMVIGQFVIIAMMVLAQAIPQAIIFLFLPIYTSTTRQGSKRKYGYFFGRTSLLSATTIDTDVNNSGEAPIVKGKNCFQAPAVKALMGMLGVEVLQREDPEGSFKRDFPGNQSSQAIEALPISP